MKAEWDSPLYAVPLTINSVHARKVDTHTHTHERMHAHAHTDRHTRVTAFHWKHTSQGVTLGGYRDQSLRQTHVYTVRVWQSMY